MKPLTYTNIFFPHCCNSSSKHCLCWKITTDNVRQVHSSHNLFPTVKRCENEERKRINTFTVFTETQKCALTSRGLWRVQCMPIDHN